MIKFVNSYYKVRKLCHDLKSGDSNAIQTSANLLSKYIKNGDVVIPMPSHTGRATYMLSIANIMHNIAGCKVLDILSSPAHEPWYNTKRKNGINSPLGYEFNVLNQKKSPNKIYVIDNVYSSGKTMNAAIAKVKSTFPNSSVNGLVIGYVDDETIKKLHYNNNLYETQNRDTKNERYIQYCNANSSQLKNLIISFLKNPEEGGKLYQPLIRSAAKSPKGNSYLRFHRTSYPGEKTCNKILPSRTQVIDFNYINKVLRLFFRIKNKYSSGFEYDQEGNLEFVVRLKEKIKKAANGKPIISNNHYISKSGKHVYRFGQVKSPVGDYYPHNYKETFMTEPKRGATWNKYFNPEYYQYDTHGHVTGYGRSNQTGGGQFPLHWFPKNGDNVNVDIPLLADSIVQTITTFNRVIALAYFIAFLKCIDSGKINGYELIKNNKIHDIKLACEEEIGQNNSKPRNLWSTKKLDTYNQDDDGRYYTLDGSSGDEDMEYQIQHLGIESIVRDSINKLITELNKKGFRS